MPNYISTPLNVNPADLAAEILADLVANIPGYIPHDGHLEVWQSAIFARMHAESRGVASRVGDDIFRRFGLRLVSLAPIDAARATTTSTWVMRDNAGYTIPAGTFVGIRRAGDELVPFRVVGAVTVGAGSTSTDAGEVLLEAVEPGVDSNGLVAGSAELIDSLAYVDTITTLADTAGGVDAETDSEYLDRLRDELTLLAPRPILADDFAILSKRIPGVYRALAIDNYIPSEVKTLSITNGSAALVADTSYFSPADVGRTVAGTGIPGGTTISGYTDEMHVTMSANATATDASASITLGALSNVPRAVAIAAVDEAGAGVNSTIRGQIVAYLDAQREVNFVVRATTPTSTNIDVAFSFTTDDDADPVVVQAAAEDAVTAFLNPGNWAGGDEAPPVWHSGNATVRRLEVASVLYAVPGLDDVTALTINGGTADVALSGVAPLPQVGTIVGTWVP